MLASMLGGLATLNNAPSMCVRVYVCRLMGETFWGQTCDWKII